MLPPHAACRLYVLCLGFGLISAVAGPRLGRAPLLRARPVRCVLPSGCRSELDAVRQILRAAGTEREPTAVSELTAGFCNWVFRVDLPEDAPLCGETSLVVKIFSPLSKLRLSPTEARAAASRRQPPARAHAARTWDRPHARPPVHIPSRLGRCTRTQYPFRPV